MRLFFLLISLILLNIYNISAQSKEPLELENPFRVGASLGYSFFGYREETYSHLNRYLNTLTFIIDGNIEKGKYFHSLNIGFFMGNAEIQGGEKAILREEYDPVK